MGWYNRRVWFSSNKCWRVFMFNIYKSKTLPAIILGGLSILAGIKIMIAGQIEYVYIFGKEKIIVGSVCVLFGLYCLVILVCEMKNRKRDKKYKDQI